MKQAWVGVLEGSPLGPIWVAVSERGLVAVETALDQATILATLERLGFDRVALDPGRTAAATRQIDEYLRGERREFDLPIDWSALTPFQQRALRATYEIPYGQVATYGELARRLDQPRAARAVGRAEATNPMPLVIPCHRLIGADGGLHGYGAGAGLETKAWLLRLEGSR
jgi:methylated-DNA-[protein]-cysteine S-methyltransferase